MPVLVRSRLRCVTFRISLLTKFAEQLLDLVGEADSELSLELVGNARIRHLNRKYCRKDQPTDVLAFAYREAEGFPSPLLGDVVVSVPMAIRQSLVLDIR